jgi:AraC family transcriptional regulator of adaptative response/methylated-DNA-[protein]-cysteine methyltransferase
VIRTARADSPFGRLLVGATAAGLCFIGFAEPDDALMADLTRRFPRATIVPDDAGLTGTLRAILAFMHEPTIALDLPLDLRGTAFQLRVWEALRRIPAGETRSYGALADMLGCPGASRAVARNRQRQRVIGADGKLRGYRWGVPSKAELLRLEALPG